MSSALKKLSNKKSYIKLLQKNNNESCSKANSNQKQRSNSGINGKKKQEKKACLNEILKQSYLHLKQENQMLTIKLRKKARKIDQLKDIIKDHQYKIKENQNTIQGLSIKKQLSHTKQSQNILYSSRKKYQQIINESKQLAKLSIEKYKKIQKQLNQQKQNYQKQIKKLKSVNFDLKMQIQALKQQKTIEKRKDRIKSHEKSKQTMNELMIKELQELKLKDKSYKNKQEELKFMLKEITQKINNYELHCKETQQKANKYRQQLQDLQYKYDNKNRKHKENNEKWHNLFRDFMKQAQCLGKEIQNSKRIFYEILKQYVNKYQR